MAESDITKLTPTFIVYLNGTRFSADMESDVREIVVQDRVDHASSFSITMSDMGRKWTDNSDFSEGTELEIWLGYKDDVHKVMTGEITGIFPGYRKNADDQVIIRGNDLLHRLDRGVKTRAFTNMTDKEIIEKIAKDVGLKAEVTDLPKANVFTMQRYQTDYEYLLAMAKQCNCTIDHREGNFIFKKREEKKDEECIVEWGKTLMDFHPRLDTSNVLTSVEVRSWDREKAEPLVGTAAYGDITESIGGGTPGGALVEDTMGDLSMIYCDDSIPDQKSADAVALDLITKNSMTYITGQGKAQGNIKIQPDMTLEIKELGERFSGDYYVNEVLHRFIPDQGFATQFKCQRNTGGI